MVKRGGKEERAVRTVMVDIKRTNPAVSYFRDNTVGSRCLRNRINFLIRNTMTGLRKSPEERSHNETEALHTVFTGIQKANRHIDELNEKARQKVISQASQKGLEGDEARIFIEEGLASLEEKKHFPYPTMEHWFLGYEVLDAIMRATKDPFYYACTSQVNQQAIRKTVASWQTYFETLQDWRQNPSKYRAKPGIPGYIREKESTATFTNQVCKVRKVEKLLFLVFTNLKEPLRIGKASMIPGKYVRTEVKPFHGGYRLCITYEDSFKAPALPGCPRRIIGLDVGVGNFLAGLSNTGAEPILIQGGYLKSLNQWFNKRRAELVSSLAKGEPTGKSRPHSYALDALSRDRENRIRDFFYKAAHWVIRWCTAHQIEVVVVGHNKEQKQEVELGRVNNQSFVSIPYTEFLSILKVVGARYGIPVVEREESYTSLASLLDGDPIPTYGQEGAEKAVFSGKRVSRGLYRASDGRTLNADVNGAGNILRKEYPHAFDGVDLSYACGKVVSITGEALVQAKPGKQHTGSRRKKCGRGAKIRHRLRREKYSFYHSFWPDI